MGSRDVYDLARRSEVGDALKLVGQESATKCATKSVRAMNSISPTRMNIEGMVSAEGIEPSTY
jgi:hypothetical protein